MTPCPCGSGHPLPVCCGPFLAGLGDAPTAEALMRSRYTAYTRGDGAYLARTQHAPADAVALGDWGRSVEWRGLTVYRTAAGEADDGVGRVWFIARFESEGRAQMIHEMSNFARKDGRWVYVSGQTPRVGRNDPCPCGSEQKYKRCCGAAA